MSESVVDKSYADARLQYVLLVKAECHRPEYIWATVYSNYSEGIWQCSQPSIRGHAPAQRAPRCGPQSIPIPRYATTYRYIRGCLSSMPLSLHLHNNCLTSNLSYSFGRRCCHSCPPTCPRGVFSGCGHSGGLDRRASEWTNL